jgi:hypothetical protein
MFSAIRPGLVDIKIKSKLFSSFGAKIALHGSVFT